MDNNIIYERIKPCPICGNIPYIEKNQLWGENGHGYPGCYSYDIKCDVCGYPKHQSGDTVYINSHEGAKAEAIKRWNLEVARIEKFLEYRNKKIE